MAKPAAVVITMLALIAVGSCAAETEKTNMGPLISREEFFECLDYSVPGMEPVAEHVKHNDLDGAARALLDYMRSRRNVKYFINHYDRSGFLNRPGYETPDGGGTSNADDILRHVFHGRMLDWYPPYEMGEKIDWEADPYGDIQWRKGLNRHNQWVILGQAYRATGDEKYAKGFVEQLVDWITTRTLDADWRDAQSASSWRTIETGLRMSATWPMAYQMFLDSPSFTSKANLLHLMSVVEQARHLEKNPTRGNILTMEMNGLFHVGVLYPEFKDARRWRETALDRLHRELTAQVYPDGLQMELSTGYQCVCIRSFREAADLCEMNGIDMPDGYLANLEKLYEAVMYLTRPSGYLPALNDEDAVIESMLVPGKPCWPKDHWPNARPLLESGARKFGRKDMLYVATLGREGEAPHELSYAFPYGGRYVMRGNWTPDSPYLVFDAGPFGAGHQHEDKLSFECYAFGETLLYDPGRYSYSDKFWRSWIQSTAAHNSALVDGLGQEQRSNPDHRKWVATEPLANVWITQDGFDYAEGVYDEGYGPQLDKSVTHRRGVLFVKNDYWIIVDRFEGTGEHKLNTLFHFAPGKVASDAQTLMCRGTNERRANVLVCPSNVRGVSVSITEGAENPPQGWISPEPQHKLPAPVADYAYSGPLPVEFAYMVYPMRPGTSAECSIKRLRLTIDGKSAPAGASAFVVRFQGGLADYILIAPGLSGKKRFAGFETDSEIAILHTDASGAVIR